MAKNLQVRIKITLLTLICMYLCSATISYAIDDPAQDPLKILRSADEIRFPTEAFQVDVKITTKAPGKKTHVRLYRLLSKGNERSIVMTLKPASDRGQIMLMKGRDLWVFMPSVSQPIRLPLSQRLTGQVANGDIARSNFAGDYHPSILRTVTIEGREHYVLELQGVDKTVTYQRVHYWVDKQLFRPYKAEFFSSSGSRLKLAWYENFEHIYGQQRPTRLVMKDALNEGAESIMDYSNMKPRKLPDKLFTKNYLKKLVK